MMNDAPEQDPDRFRTLDALLDAALDVPSEARSEFVERVCAGNAELRRELTRLVDLVGWSDGFLESPAIELQPGWVESLIRRTRGLP